MKNSKLIRYTLAVAILVVVAILTWRLTSPKHDFAATEKSSTSSQASGDPQSKPAGAQSDGTGNSAPGQGSQVVINGRTLDADQLQAIETRYRGTIPPGRYWYDSRSGFWGLEGYAVAGYISPGIDFGQLSPNASHGNTGVFVNGRELNQAEALFFARIFGSYQVGRFWLDGNTGYVGVEGDPTPRDNLFARIRQSQGGSQALSGGGMVGISNGGCMMVTTDTGYNASTPGCD